MARRPSCKLRAGYRDSQRDASVLYFRCFCCLASFFCCFWYFFAALRCFLAIFFEAFCCCLAAFLASRLFSPMLLFSRWALAGSDPVTLRAAINMRATACFMTSPNGISCCDFSTEDELGRQRPTLLSWCAGLRPGLDPSASLRAGSRGGCHH